MKFAFTSDTSIYSMKGYFKKLQGNTLCSSAFHYSKFNGQQCLGEYIYTGDSYILASKSDSSVQVLMKSKAYEEILLHLRQNGLLYYPFTNTRSFPFYTVNGQLDDNYEVKQCGKEKIDDRMCWHIRLRVKNSEIRSEGVKVINVEFDYWIDRHTFLPMQFTSLTDAIFNEEVVNQFEKFVLLKYEINTNPNDTLFTLQSLPKYFKTNTLQ